MVDTPDSGSGALSKGREGSNPSPCTRYAQVVETVDMMVSKTMALRHAGSSPVLRTNICTGDGTGILARLRTGFLRVRIPSCAPFYAQVVKSGKHIRLKP